MTRTARRLLAAAAAAVSALALGVPAAQAAPARNGVVSFVQDASPIGIPCVGSWSWEPNFIEADRTAWAPNGVQAAILDPNGALIVINTRTCAKRTVATGVSRFHGLAFTPDSRSIAISRNGDLFLISAGTGATVRKLTSTRLIVESDPSFSPDGKSVAYRREGAIWIQTIATGQSIRWRVGAINPQYSPDGTKIAYQVYEGDEPAYNRGDGRIWYAPVTGGTPKDTLIDANADDFVWSPDGTAFAFSAASTGENAYTIFLARTTGRIYQSVGGTPSSGVSWQPLR
ncbi:TolB family protein [Kineococcus radiotolerans]|uniref:WD40 domain protein beta Propeller n=1 Tax=Kineococcus radiotolerans (strain ATCC BAA-149 / DSM 14245 / SRS30216) TaxID=266940 RepID=A6W8P3_KINRD|nr:PD40 domain-containing protein [Kineococcus radiotolerans]ABS03182.1 WD40 domain protein beta Propeller [Kineococcus radiotolerans SRS30216 = ATCC BAA-149]